MSDILIKGMEMPASCQKCVCSDDGGRYCNAAHEFIPMMGRPSFCPLVEIPPHGRLIDADVLADVFRGFIAMYDSCPFSQLAPTDKARRDELQAALAEVINAPTIIPTEEGE